MQVVKRVFKTLKSPHGSSAVDLFPLAFIGGIIVAMLLELFGK